MRKLWIFSSLMLLGGCASNCGFWNASPPSWYPPSWVAHEYEVIEVEDRGHAFRDRLRVRISAPTAITSEDRVATAMEAALHFSEATGFDFVNAFIEATPSLYGLMLAEASYAPDGCGVSGTGDHCTGLIWTDLRSTDMQLTQEQLEIWDAWERNKEDFTERIEFGEASYKQVNEERLKEFLAEKFATIPDHISDQMLSKARLIGSLKKIELP